MIPASRRRLWVLYVVVLALLAGLGTRLWNVQVLNTRTYAAAAAADDTQQIVVPAVRGEILDDTGQALVANKSSLAISVNVTELIQHGDEATVLHRLARLLHLRYKTMTEKVRICNAHVGQPCWPGSPYQPIPVAQRVSSRTALQILESPQSYPDVTAQLEPVVSYPMPDGANPAQMLGYLQPITQQEITQRHLSVTGFSGVDLVGQAGLEEEYDAALRGTPGIQRVAINAQGVVTKTVSTTAAKPGDDLITSINAPLQADVQNILSAAVAKARAGGANETNGAAVVETTTGRIVAMASYPDYDPSVWTGGISRQEYHRLFGAADGEPILNQVTQGEYAPGSTWKVTTTAAAVANGYSLYGEYDCPASVSIGGTTFQNDGEPNEGEMPLSEALIQSCDTVYYELGYGMWQRDDVPADSELKPNRPVQKMAKMELAWGFGRDTGIDLPEQSPGIVPTRNWLYHYWKDPRECRAIYSTDPQFCADAYVWEPGQAAIAAIGQGYVNVTPLQLANAYVALANGGTLYSPRIGEALVSPDGKLVKKINPPVIRHLPVAGSTLAYIRQALQGVVTRGTAASAFGGFPLGKVCVAGKTGTAQATDEAPNSVFASFAPCGHPKYVVVVLMPNTGYGADFAAPAVRKIWDALYGLERSKGALPNGQVPTRLPSVSSSGVVSPPPGYGGSPP